MVEVSAHTLGETRDCRMPNCPLDASDAPTRGPYANLCPHHEREAKVRVAAKRSSTVARRQPLVVVKPSTDVSLKAAAMALVPAANALERAVTAHKVAKSKRQEAFNEFQAALKAVKASAESLLQR